MFMGAIESTSVPVVEADRSDDAPVDGWQESVRRTAADIRQIIPPGESFILIDEDEIRYDLDTGHRVLPFLERNGEYWGAPENDVVAAQELLRLRMEGVGFLVVAWPAFWWLDYYPRLYRQLRWSFRCVMRNERLIVFDLVARSPLPWRWSVARLVPHVSDIKYLGARASAFRNRLQSLLSVLRLWFVPDAGATLHLCALLESVHSCGIPTVELERVLASLQQSDVEQEAKVRMHPLLRGGGSGSVSEMAVLSVLTATKRPETILEFGTYDGCSTWHLWANSPESTRIITLDLPAKTKVEGSTDYGLQGVMSRTFLPASPRVQLIEMDSRLWDPATIGQVDFCFIDAGHSYECVKNDTEKALAVMREGGVIVWHDASWRRDGYGVNRYLRELREEGRDVQLITIGEFDYCSIAVLVL
jgi:predicted O-methyltransferase YrrM